MTEEKKEEVKYAITYFAKLNINHRKFGVVGVYMHTKEHGKGLYFESREKLAQFLSLYDAEGWAGAVTFDREVLHGRGLVEHFVDKENVPIYVGKKVLEQHLEDTKKPVGDGRFARFSCQ